MAYSAVMEMVDMPGRSIFGNVSRLWTPKFWFGGMFCMRGGLFRGKRHHLVPHCVLTTEGLLFRGYASMFRGGFLSQEITFC